MKIDWDLVKAVVFLLAVFFGPPAYFVLSNWGEPMREVVTRNKTVEVVESTGFLGDAILPSVGWIFFVFFIFFVLYHAPAPPRSFI